MGADLYYEQLLQSIPVEHFQKHELRSMTLEYRRECHSNDVVESLGSPSCIKPVCKSSDTNCSAPSSSSSLQVAQNFKELKSSTNEISAAHGLHSSCDQSITHLLRLQGVEEEILRGRTVWKPR
ncbi:unnamed protein product [Sphagnum troendelagicum]|uniref:Acyl-ACP thioesterase-like C-terminal domain-containing protein n=1 Tax=Sphagnum troendelagicum TaxID=128251 RepID=A0ABP0U3I0_9BRYO